MGFKRKIQALIAALIAAPLAAQDYDPVVIPPQIIGSPQTMTPLNGGDDSTRLVQFAFPFEYFGQTYTQAWVSSNGFVSFNNVGHLCCDGWPIENAPRNTIYGLWTDLISGGNPYYKSDSNITLFGWYNTQEYGSWQTNTLEIALFPDGKIQWNYGDVTNVYHTVTAGLTGPTMADSISLFYGQNVNLLDNTSYVAGVPASAPEPPPPPAVVSIPTPGPTASPAPVMTAEEQTQFEAAVDAVFEAIGAQEEATPAQATTAVVEEIAQEPVQETQAEETSEAATEEAPAEESSEETSSSSETTKSSGEQSSGSPPPPPGFSPTGGPAATTTSSGQESEKAVASEVRRDRNVDFFQREAIEEADLFQRETVLQATVQNVAFLAQADAQYSQQFGPQTTTETAGVTYSLQPTEGPTFSPVLTTVIGDTSVSSPTSQAQQMELLNMGGMQSEMAAGTPTDVGDVNTGDGDAMVQLAAVPEGYSAYTQARIPDLPFYQPKDIYKGRRIPDQNMALYVMMRGQDYRWQEMVDDQYE